MSVQGEVQPDSGTEEDKADPFLYPGVFAVVRLYNVNLAGDSTVIADSVLLVGVLRAWIVFPSASHTKQHLLDQYRPALWRKCYNETVEKQRKHGIHKPQWLLHISSVIF